MRLISLPNGQGTFANELLKAGTFLLLIRAGLLAAVVLGGGVSAIAQTRPSLTQSQTTSLPATQTQLFVDPTTNNARADGSERSPFRTLTRALQAAQPNTVIRLAAGTYSTETGETFPIALKAGVTLQGNPESLGKDIVIRGGGTFRSSTSAAQNIAILGADQAELVGITVTNPQGHGLWIESSSPTVRNSTFTGSAQDGISMAGKSSPVIRNSLFVVNGVNGVTVLGDSHPEVRDNTFIRTGSGIGIAENATPLVINNRISQNQNGIVIQANARPVLRGNTIEDSEQDGLIAIAQSQPDLGTATEPGNNVFTSNGRYDLNVTETSRTVPAFGNQLANNRSVGKIDLTGNTPLATASTAARPATSAVSASATNRPSTVPPNQPVASASLTPTDRSSAVAVPINRPPMNLPMQRSRPPASSSPLISTLPPSSGSGAAVSPSVATVSQTSLTVPAVSRASLTTNPTTASKQAASSPMARQTAIEISVPPPPVSTSSTTVPTSQAAAQISVPPPGPSSLVAAAGQTAVLARFSSNSSAQTPTPALQTAIVPVSSPASLPRQIVAAVSRSTPVIGAPISIPVPPPESSQSSSSSAGSSSGSPTRTSLLPVPNGEIPLGNTGDMPRINVSGDPTQRTASSAVFTDEQTSLRYRVVVDASSDQEVSLVRSLVPSAFSTSTNGQPIIQVGAFSSRDNAEEAVEMLNKNGLKATIQQID